MSMRRRFNDKASASIDTAYGVDLNSVVDRLASLADSPAGVVNAEATTVTRGDGDLTVYVRAQAEAPGSELYQFGYAPEAGTVNQPLVVGHPHLAGNQSMRPAASTDYDVRENGDAGQAEIYAVSGALYGEASTVAAYLMTEISGDGAQGLRGRTSVLH